MTKDEMQEELVKFALKCQKDPLKFVQKAFPWGEGVLADFDGPDAWQTDVLTQMRDHIKSGDSFDKVFRFAAASGNGIGKALSNDVVVDTPDGRKRWGDIKVGDYLWGQDGKPTKVIAIPYEGKRPFYRVKFDDGSSTIACKEHLWTVIGRQERRYNKGWTTIETQEIINRGVRRKNGKQLTRQFEIPLHKAVELPEKRYLIHPYLLGVYLGNGGRLSGAITTNDNEVIERIEELGYKFSKTAKTGTTCVSLTTYGLRERLRTLGLINCYSYDKSIPDEYLRGSIEQRSELFRGLVDTDGEVTKTGSLVYSSTSKSLAEGFVWLARSLGGKARISPTVKKAFYRGKDGEKIHCRDCYRVVATMPRGFKCGYVKRKADRILETLQDRYLKRWIDSIEYVGELDGKCVTVDRADGLFLANDFIVTHNSCLVSWILLWSMATMSDTRGVVTANTEIQLTTKTFAELQKWYNVCIYREWFEKKSMSLSSTQVGHDKTWRVDAIAWSENRPEAMAGTHNNGKRIVIIFDEASAIADSIWDAIEGAMTDKNTQIFWLVFGNPTRSTGRFFDCFNKFSHRWIHKNIDSREAKASNKDQIQAWIEDYGEDSDFVKVHVRGVFPSSSSMQFIPRDVADGAAKKHMAFIPYVKTTAIIGVDVARFGDDSSVITTRFAQDARSQGQKVYKNLDGWQLGSKVAEVYNDLRRQGVQKIIINVDVGGVGASPVDWLNNNGYTCNAINFGSAASNPRFKNLRAEMWWRCLEWMKAGGCIEDNEDLITDLTSVEYSYTAGKNELILERKEDMKKRGLRSPDRADSLCLTFAVLTNEYVDELPDPVQRRSFSKPIRSRNPYG